MFSIVIKEIKEFLRDKASLFYYILFPIMLVFLLGNLLSQMDKAENVVGEIKLQFLIQTDDPYQIEAIHHFMTEVEDDRNLLIEEAIDMDTAKRLAGKDEITALVVFSGNPLKINIYEGTNRIKNRTVSAIFNSFARMDQSIMTILHINPEVMADLQISQEEFIQQKDLGVNRSMLDYYAVCMLAMTAFLSMMIGAGAFLGERENKTLSRLIIAPQNRIFLFFQKIMGCLPQIILQFGIIMLVSVVVFRAHYAATLLDNLYLLGMFIIVSLAMVCIGAVVGLLIKSNPTVFILPVLWVMMFFSGTYSKEIYIAGFTNRMPIYQIQQAAFDLTLFGRYQKAINVAIVCTIIIAVTLVIGAWIFNRLEEER